MNYSRKSAAKLAAAAFVLTVRSTSAIAQAPANGAQPPQLPPAAQEFLSGLNLGPFMMSMGGAQGMMIDFTRSNERILLKRGDVRSELFVDSKQREKILDADTQGNKDMQAKMQETVVQSLLQNPDLQAATQGGTPDLGALKDSLNQGFQKITDTMQNYQSDLDVKAEGILNAKQIKRLHELDLQYRGLLSLSDKKVAEAIALTPDQKAVVDLALKDYMKAQMAVLQPAMMGMMQGFGNGAGPGSPGFDPQAIQKTITDALESDAVKKARSTAEAKVKSSLKPDQIASWTKMNGQKFEFRHVVN